jgi:hypothetical protein
VAAKAGRIIAEKEKRPKTTTAANAALPARNFLTMNGYLQGSHRTITVFAGRVCLLDANRRPFLEGEGDVWHAIQWKSVHYRNLFPYLIDSKALCREAKPTRCLCIAGQCALKQAGMRQFTQAMRLVARKKVSPAITFGLCLPHAFVRDFRTRLASVCRPPTQS